MEFGRWIIFLNPTSIVFRFFIEFITYMPDATYLTRIIELPVGKSNGTTFKHKPKRGNGIGTTWERYSDTFLDVFLVWSIFQLLYVGLQARSYFSCFGLVVDTSRRKLSPSQMPLAQSIRLLHILVSYSPPRTVNFKEGDMATFFTGSRNGATSENVSPPTTGHQKGKKMVDATAGTPRYVCP